MRRWRCPRSRPRSGGAAALDTAPASSAMLRLSVDVIQLKCDVVFHEIKDHMLPRSRSIIIFSSASSSVLPFRIYFLFGPPVMENGRLAELTDFPTCPIVDQELQSWFDSLSVSIPLAAVDSEHGIGSNTHAIPKLSQRYALKGIVPDARCQLGRFRAFGIHLLALPILWSTTPRSTPSTVAEISHSCT